MKYREMEYLHVLSMGEYVRQAVVLSTVLAGFSLGAALVVGRDKGEPARDRVVNPLSVASVLFMCALYASALYLFKMGSGEKVLESLPEVNEQCVELFEAEQAAKKQAQEAIKRDIAESTRFEVLFWISHYGSLIGMGLVMIAIGESGYLRGKGQGHFTRAVAWLGAAALFCTLWLAW